MPDRDRDWMIGKAFEQAKRITDLEAKLAVLVGALEDLVKEAQKESDIIQWKKRAGTASPGDIGKSIVWNTVTVMLAPALAPPPAPVPEQKAGEGK